MYQMLLNLIIKPFFCLSDCFFKYFLLNHEVMSKKKILQYWAGILSQTVTYEYTIC